MARGGWFQQYPPNTNKGESLRRDTERKGCGAPVVCVVSDVSGGVRLALLQLLHITLACMPVLGQQLKGLG